MCQLIDPLKELTAAVRARESVPFICALVPALAVAHEILPNFTKEDVTESLKLILDLSWDDRARAVVSLGTRLLEHYDNSRDEYMLVEIVQNSDLQLIRTRGTREECEVFRDALDCDNTLTVTRTGLKISSSYSVIDEDKTILYKGTSLGCSRFIFVNELEDTDGVTVIRTLNL